MRTEQFPPICPYGDSCDDALVLRRQSAKTIVWSVAKNHFLRVNVYSDGDVTYLLGTRKEIQDDILDPFEDIEGALKVESGAGLLKSCRLARIAKALGLPQ